MAAHPAGASRVIIRTSEHLHVFPRPRFNVRMFGSLWLIPRLRRFTALHSDIDVRISATTDNLNLERSLIDLAIRYCKPETVVTLPASEISHFISTPI